MHNTKKWNEREELRMKNVKISFKDLEKVWKRIKRYLKK